MSSHAALWLFFLGKWRVYRHFPLGTGLNILVGVFWRGHCRDVSSATAWPPISAAALCCPTAADRPARQQSRLTPPLAATHPGTLTAALSPGRHLAPQCHDLRVVLCLLFSVRLARWTEIGINSPTDTGVWKQIHWRRNSARWSR